MARGICSRADAVDQEVASFHELLLPDPERMLSRYPHELSGGQKQRLNIACALAAEPNLLICDEIISSLDQIVTHGILEVLDRLRSGRDLSLMFIRHDIATVRSIADSVVVMQAGCLVEKGEKETLLSALRKVCTQELLASRLVPAERH